ncbi:MAG: hypothetical protein CBD47_08000 [Synechococcus sp. TMED187]|nr:MAG: hypothetical protein CBD47_08000 [Synechococcus sp. TMED187]
MRLASACHRPYARITKGRFDFQTCHGGRTEVGKRAAAGLGERGARGANRGPAGHIPPPEGGAALDEMDDGANRRRARSPASCHRPAPNERVQPVGSGKQQLVAWLRLPPPGRLLRRRRRCCRLSRSRTVWRVRQRGRVEPSGREGAQRAVGEVRDRAERGQPPPHEGLRMALPVAPLPVAVGRQHVLRSELLVLQREATGRGVPLELVEPGKLA